ncbi:unnamed protein product [Schistosoma margrebowiei]|uniref:Uncharacterized protein n=1 Tax=Schistosoma margrebowiei TaxID=48269 RepID=A0A183MZ00_9TREM|nr:unnamed protein product [Schistosoma margrebowiei]
MKTSTSERKHGVQWKAWIQLDCSRLYIRGSDADVKSRIGKARAAGLQLNNIWNSKQLSTNTNVRIFNTNVKTDLLYGAATWRTTDQRMFVDKEQ